MGSKQSSESKTNEFLIPDHELTSVNGDFHPVMKQNDDFVIFYASKIKSESSVWTSDEWNWKIQGSFSLQTRSDNDLTMYYTDNPQIVWKFDATKKAEAKYRLLIENEKRLVIMDANGKPVRLYMKSDSSRTIGNSLNVREKLKRGYEMTSKNGQYHAMFQYDGNFVIYYPTKHKPSSCMWKTGTNESKKPQPFSLVMREDGNLTITDAKNESVWTTNIEAKGRSAQKAVIEDNGELVIYDEYRKMIWSSKHKITKPN